MDGIQAAAVTYEHDARGRLTKATYNDGAVIDYTYDANGNRTAAILTLPADVTPPASPTNLVAVAASGSQINLNWSAATDNVGVTGYRLERCAGVACTSFSQIATPATTAYSDAGLASGATYVYRVRAHDAAGNVSPYSASSGASTTPDTAAPTAPGTPVFSNVAMNSATASWTAASDNVGVTRYEFRLNAGTWQVLGNVLSINLTALSAATRYTFDVRARDGANNVGAASSGAFTTLDTQAPSAPTALAASAPSSSTVNLSWAASTDNVAVSGYKIFRNGAQIATRTTTSYADSAVSGSTAYTYAVSAYDAAGNNSALSSSVSVTTPDTLAPSTPTGLVASAASPTRVNISWGASTDSGGSGLAGYRVYRNGAQIAATAAASHADAGVAGGTTYSYTAAAYDNAGNVSAQSSAASATTPPALSATVSATTWNYLKVGKAVTYDPNIVVTASGGSGGGYTYLWERISGDTSTSIIGATSSSVQWTRSQVPNDFVDYRSVWRCRVTDSAGSVTYAPNVTVNFRGEW